MPRASNIHASHALIKALIIGDPKAGKTDWAVRAAEAGFNVLLMDGDVAIQTVQQLSQAAKERIFYMDVSDNLVGESDPRMIETVAGFMTSSRFLWNDRTQREFSAIRDPKTEDGFAADEIWEFRPAKLNENWVFIPDSWTTLAYSAMIAKANDMGESLADVEKIERGIYSGVGNRLTNIAATIQKMPCHVIVPGHSEQYEKTKSPENKTVKEVKETEKIIEWTKMIPKSSSKPHGLTLGKFFSDVGWMEVDKWGKRKLSFVATNTRVSGGHLNSVGDPRESHSFAALVKSIGGTVPGPGGAPLGEALTIWESGTFKPATIGGKPNSTGGKPAVGAQASESIVPDAKPSTIKGLGGLAGLKK